MASEQRSDQPRTTWDPAHAARRPGANGEMAAIRGRRHDVGVGWRIEPGRHSTRGQGVGAHATSAGDVHPRRGNGRHLSLEPTHCAVSAARHDMKRLDATAAQHPGYPARSVVQACGALCVGDRDARTPAPQNDDGAGLDVAVPLRRVDEPPAARARARGGSERGGQHAPYAARASSRTARAARPTRAARAPSTGIGRRRRRRRGRPRCSLRPRRPALCRHRSHTKLRPPPPPQSTSRDERRTSCVGGDGDPPHLAPPSIRRAADPSPSRQS
jgi:hypothetical protein